MQQKEQMNIVAHVLCGGIGGLSDETALHLHRSRITQFNQPGRDVIIESDVC